MKEAKELLEKYKILHRKSEYVSIGQVINDLHNLVRDYRIKRIPKKNR